MLLLAPDNRILRDTVASKFEESKEAKPIDSRLCDFDDVLYHISSAADAATKLVVSMSMPCYKDIKAQGAEDRLKAVFGDVLASTPEDGYDVTLNIDLTSPPADLDKFLANVGLLKSHAIGGVYDSFFTAVLEKKSKDPFKFKVRSDTTVYLVPGDDRVTVVFDLEFHDKVDLAVANVFLREFKETKRRLHAAPPCQFTDNPPAELQSFGVTEPTGSLGFLSFAILESHLKGDNKDKVVHTLQMFRNYVQYHIKCAKSYFHSRMRARVTSLLKVLNRAKSEPAEEDKSKKTFSGKSFNRK